MRTSHTYRYTIQLKLILVALILTVATGAQARRLKVITYPKEIAAGQLGIVIFDNPAPDKPMARTNCTADRLIAWVKSDIPILRIEQKGKQVWTSIGSYYTIGDSSIASFMAPTTLEPGPATLFVVNDRDASVPYPFTVITTYSTSLTKIVGSAIEPLKAFTLIGSGFVPTSIVNTKPAIDELIANVGYDKMPPIEQWYTLNRRIINDWDKIAMGNFLTVAQNGKEWRTFVDGCGVDTRGLSLDFQAPPDLKPGPVTLTLSVRMNHQEVARSEPLTVMVQ